MAVNPIHPGGSPRDILRQQRIQEIAQQAPKRNEVVKEITSLLQENKLNNVFVQHLNALGMVIVWLKENATEEHKNKVVELLKNRGAIEVDKEKGLYSMNGVEFSVCRNGTVYAA